METTNLIADFINIRPFKLCNVSHLLVSRTKVVIIRRKSEIIAIGVNRVISGVAIVAESVAVFSLVQLISAVILVAIVRRS